MGSGASASGFLSPEEKIKLTLSTKQRFDDFGAEVFKKSTLNDVEKHLVCINKYDEILRELSNRNKKRQNLNSNDDVMIREGGGGGEASNNKTEDKPGWNTNFEFAQIKIAKRKDLLGAMSTQAKGKLLATARRVAIVNKVATPAKKKNEDDTWEKNGVVAATKGMMMVAPKILLSKLAEEEEESSSSLLLLLPTAGTAAVASSSSSLVKAPSSIMPEAAQTPESQKAASSLSAAGLVVSDFTAPIFECVLCKKTFASNFLLEKHTNYSPVHQEAVKLRDMQFAIAFKKAQKLSQIVKR